MDQAEVAHYDPPHLKMSHLIFIFTIKQDPVSDWLECAVQSHKTRIYTMHYDKVQVDI